MNTRCKKFLTNRSGMTGVLTAICLFVFVGLLALVIDLGHLQGVKSELQNAADSAALAGARRLLGSDEYPWVAPLGGNYGVYTAATPDCLDAVNQARQASSSNRSDGQPLPNTVEVSNVVLGWWDFDNNRFEARPSCTWADVNAVQVTVRRTEDSGSPVFLTLARLFGSETAGVVAIATAALMPQGYVTELPAGPFNNIAIQKRVLDSLAAGQPGNLNPADPTNSFWCSQDGQPYAFTNNLRKWLKDGSPPIEATGRLNLEQGVRHVNDKLVLEDMKTFLSQRSRSWEVDGQLYNGWLLVIPVINYGSSAQAPVNPTGMPINPLALVRWLFEVREAHACYAWRVPIVKLQPIIITQVVPTGKNKRIEFKVAPWSVVVVGGSSGGGPSTVYATRPKLVR
ncbi:MAG: hypothetical protein FJ128_00120 [Deltaproteobacteria bacterium]|nr:hypothetical protein [Deltaproteobacteria bacterium]